MPLNIDAILTSLASERPIFHSEADLQHALAWHTKLIHPDAHVRLEIPADFLRQSRASIDMLVRLSGAIEYIELKYKTVNCDVMVRDERFRLKRGAAKDQGSYSFIKDIMRVESFVGSAEQDRGHAIILTNDSTYWSPSSKVNPIDPDFHLLDGRSLSGRLTWASHAGEGSMKGYEEPLVLRGSYRLQWRTYPGVGLPAVPAFRYLHIPVGNAAATK